MTSFDHPHLCVTDSEPSFQQLFTDFLRAHHIDHRYSSSYRPQSSSPAEGGVRSIKDVLVKLPSITKKVLREVVFNINNNQSQDGSGSPSEGFFLRGIRTIFPNSFRKKLETADLMKIRSDKQMKMAMKKGRISKDVFTIGDKIRVCTGCCMEELVLQG